MLTFIPWLVFCFVAFRVLKWVKRKYLSKVSFAGKTIWITGASSGIGEALVYQVNKLGATVLISARRKEELERVKNSCANPNNVVVIPLDMSEPESTEKQVEKILAERKDLSIDILINNAGMSMRVAFLENDLASDIKIFNLNVLSQIAISRVVLRRMKTAKKGQIVNISSVGAKVATPFRTAYASSKLALIGYFDSVRAEMKEHNITVTNILPGYVNTNLSHAAIGGKGGVAFGKEDPHLLNGMAAEKFAELSAEAIYFKDNEVIITKKLLHRAAVIFRGIWPDAVFLYLQKVFKKEMMKYVDYGKKD